MSHIDEDQIVFTDKPAAALPPVRSEPLLADQVAAMETKCKALEQMCGTILATIRVNLDKQALVCVSHSHAVLFSDWVDEWTRNLDTLTANSEGQRPAASGYAAPSGSQIKEG